MKRIEPECFIEWYKDDCDRVTDNDIQYIEDLDTEIKRTEKYNFKTIAIFYIKPQTTSLEERMRIRRKNNIPNYNLLTN